MPVKPADLPAVKHYYKQFRAHGQPALAAWNMARSQLHFSRTLAADVAAYKRRSRAAKAGWKRRRAAV